MATAAHAANVSAEQEALKLGFSYLVNSIDPSSLLPVALSKQLITEQQRSECSSEQDAYKKVEKFLSHLQRAVNGDNRKFYTFVQILRETGQASIALSLEDELRSVTRSTESITSSSTQGEQVIVPDELVEELADLRFNFAELLHSYEKEIRNNAEAQKEFVTFLPKLFRREENLSHSLNFQSYFNRLEEKVSLFNIHYLKRLCSIFPEDVRTATTELVQKYEQHCHHFMAGTTVSQFKALFPVSATPSKLSNSKTSIILKLKKEWDKETLEDLANLVDLFGVPGIDLHLSKVRQGCIAVTWLCSTDDVKNLRTAISDVADSLQTKGVLQILVEEEIIWECSQPEQDAESYVHHPELEALHLVSKTEIDWLCPICTEPLTEPFHTKCGHLLCRNCHDRLISMNKTECPTCRKPDALHYARLNKFLQRKVNSLKVRCLKYNEGCQWMGELGELSNHVKKCGILCPKGCCKYILRSEMKEHMMYHCHKRPTTCEFCGYHNTYDIVTEQHYPLCLRFPIHCPHKCTEKRFERCQLQQHLSECPSQLVECPFSSTGCSVYLPRKEIAAHLLQQHNQVLSEHAIDQAVAITPPPATASPQYLYNLPPVVFTMTDFLEKKQANEVWTSPPYYTHTGGYKFCLKVYANGYGSGKDTHVSVFVCLMRGEYDHMLQWPFEGVTTIELCNWREGKNSISEAFYFNRLRDEEGIFSAGFDSSEFVSYTQLAYNSATNTEYLYLNCLQLRVKKVDIYSNALLHKVPSWQSHTAAQSVSEFTLNEFSKRKQHKNSYISPPFYTHPQGYKLCTKVFANGVGSSEGTHVSIFVILMKGEHDQHLQWPFTGEVIFELLNWRKDDEHHKVTLTISTSCSFVQVTEGTYGTSQGYHRFISHSSLSCTFATDTEYLQQDCLRLRVSYFSVCYSTALLYKTPAWQDFQATTQPEPVCEFTLTDFSKRKRFNNQYFSPSFYTHPLGYKMYIHVYANGCGSGKDTYISIFATLTKGEHDQYLPWPFTGDIIFELLNWLEDKRHYIRTLKITAADGYDQVTGKEKDGMSRGKIFFIPHSSLLYNSFTNTQYLQDDCLRIRVIVSNVN